MTLIVVFGAAVRADGSPSPALQRRITYAAEAAASDPQAVLFCSGARGRVGPSEASVMRSALAQVVDPSRLYADEASVDTLQTVRAAVAYARAHGHDECLVCTDRYHQPRARMLFALFGMRSRSLMFAPSTARRSRGWQRMWLREAAALPYDLVAGIGGRLAARRG